MISAYKIVRAATGTFIDDWIVFFRIFRSLLRIETFMTSVLSYCLIGHVLYNGNGLGFYELCLLIFLPTAQNVIVWIEYARLFFFNWCLTGSKLCLEHLPSVITLERSFVFTEHSRRARDVEISGLERFLSGLRFYWRFLAGQISLLSLSSNSCLERLFVKRLSLSLLQSFHLIL